MLNAYFGFIYNFVLKYIYFKMWSLKHDYLHFLGELTVGWNAAGLVGSIMFLGAENTFYQVILFTCQFDKYMSILWSVYERICLVQPILTLAGLTGQWSSQNSRSWPWVGSQLVGFPFFLIRVCTKEGNTRVCFPLLTIHCTAHTVCLFDHLCLDWSSDCSYSMSNNIIIIPSHWCWLIDHIFGLLFYFFHHFFHDYESGFRSLVLHL